MWQTSPDRSRSTSSFAASALEPTSLPSSVSERGPCSASAEATLDGDGDEEGAEQDEGEPAVDEPLKAGTHPSTLVVPRDGIEPPKQKALLYRQLPGHWAYAGSVVVESNHRPSPYQSDDLTN